jgi:hypothetical protein
VGTTISSTVITDAEGRATTIATAVPFTTVRPVTTVVANVSNNDNAEPKVLTFPLWTVFVAGYVPVLLAILFKSFWTAIYAKVKLVEPFTQLARPEGAVVADTLHTYYLSSNLTPDPIISFRKGHWLVFWTSFVYVVVGLVVSFASEVLFLDTNYQCEAPHPTSANKYNPCWPPRLSVDPQIARILQGLLGFIAVMTITVLTMLLRCSTGLNSDPSSIGTIASLMHHPEVLADFRSMDDGIMLDDMRSHLGDQRYRLAEYQSPDGVRRYGFVPVKPIISNDLRRREVQGFSKTYSEDSQRERILDTVYDSLFGAFLLGLLGVIIAYCGDFSNSSFNRFFNSNAFGPRFFMVCYYLNVDNFQFRPLTDETDHHGQHYCNKMEES